MALWSRREDPILLVRDSFKRYIEVGGTKKNNKSRYLEVYLEVQDTVGNWLYVDL